jgi:predicted DNA-binding transcriptional regulator AlpA
VEAIAVPRTDNTPANVPENASTPVVAKNKKKHINPPESLVVSAAHAGALSGVSEATWWRLHAAAKVPASIKVGHRTLWRRSDVEKWIELGCPNRAEFEARTRTKK